MLNASGKPIPPPPLSSGKPATAVLTYDPTEDSLDIQETKTTATSGLRYQNYIDDRRGPTQFRANDSGVPGRRVY